jgi:hypothetical protein
MDNVDAIVKEAVNWYASGGFRSKTFFVTNPVENAYAVLVADVPVHKRPARIIVFARIVGEYVVIEEDTTDRPLVDKLTAKGIPREKIIRAYAGESLPEGLESPALP